MPKIYLDDNGNPIPAAPAAGKVYLDDNGNPIPPAAAAAPAQPGFWENLGKSFGIDRDANAWQQWKNHPVASLMNAIGGPAFQAAAAGAGGFMRTTDELGQAVDALRAGNPAAAGVHAVTAVPMLGPALNQMSDEAPAAAPGQSYLSQVAADATRGNLGTALGTAAQVAPMALGAGDEAFPGRPTIPNPAGVSAIGSGMRAIGQNLAESALGVRNTDRAFDADPGHAIMTETSGLRPSVIAKQAQQRLNDLVLERATLAQANRGPVDFSPARAVASDAMQEQALRNAIPQIDRMAPLAEQIRTQGEPSEGWPIGVRPPRAAGRSILPIVETPEALNLREGVGSYAADRPWTGKASADPLRGMVRGMYGSMSDSIHSAVPEIAPLDARMHDLIPVAQRAAETDLNASTLQRIAGRFARPTGALFGAGAGSAYGYQAGGVPGALAGGVVGLVTPEVIASPTVQMGVARAIHGAPGLVSGVAGAAVPPAAALIPAAVASGPFPSAWDFVNNRPQVPTPTQVSVSQSVYDRIPDPVRDGLIPSGWDWAASAPMKGKPELRRYTANDSGSSKKN